MKTLLYLLFLLPVLLLSMIRVSGQTGFAGKVVDKTTGEPLAGTAVFINNSTYAQVCDVEGHFDLSSFPSPPFELTIAVVGYKTATLQVTASTARPLEIALEARPVDLREATVLSAEKDGWRKYGKQFTDDFIGYSPFAAQCTILNKDVLQFRYDAQDNTLTVWAEQPLRIRNEATGYQITYWLEDYVKHYTSRRLFFRGYTQFADLNSQKKRKKKSWTQNRGTAYHGSLNHFMRSLCQGSTAGEGFAIRRMKRIAGSDYGKYVPVWTDTIPFADSSRLRTLIAHIGNDTAGRPWEEAAFHTLMLWKDTGTLPTRFIAPSPEQVEDAPQQYLFARDVADPDRMIVKYYDLNRLSPQDSLMNARLSGIRVESKMGTPAPAFRSRSAFDMVNPAVISADSFIRDRSASSVRFSFAEYLFVTYTPELEERAYLDRRPGGSKLSPGAQASIISLASEKGIMVYPDGNFAPAYDLMAEDYWAYEKLDKLLPLDYRP